MHRRFLAVLFLGLVLLAALVGPALAADTKQVGLVVAFPDGTKYADLITVPVDATTFDVLQKAKIQLVSTAGQFGPAVCGINGVGCDAKNCFCDSKHFWAFYQLNAQANQWVSSQEGAGTVKPANGAVVGFIWSGLDANFNPTDKPPVMSFEQIKAQAGSGQAQAATPAAAQAATGSAQATATRVSAPTSLPTTGGVVTPVWLLAAGIALLGLGGLLAWRGRVSQG